jgi:predicted glycosyltransferase
MIPRILHRDEQLIRAERLHDLGLVHCLHPDSVTPEKLYAAIRASLANGEPLTRGREEGRIPLDGAEGMVKFCNKLRVACPAVPQRA